MKDFKNIAEYVNGLSLDIKAEVLVAILQNGFVDENDILVAFDGQLKRNYSRDVDRVSVDEFEGGDKALQFHLNRDGVYDALPEALFHRFSDEVLGNGNEMARDSVKLRNEEKQVRLFFRPFENQVFLQLAKLSGKENSVFSNIYTNLIQGIIPDFWNIHKEIPKEFAERLVRLIPVAHKIIGKLELTRQAFEFILKETVNISLVSVSTDTIALKSQLPKGGGLGECVLGIDMISGDIPEISGHGAHVSIGPIKKLDIRQYIRAGWLKTLLETMYSYFLPMGLSVNTFLIPDRESSGMVLDEELSESSSFLGFNSVLD